MQSIKFPQLKKNETNTITFFASEEHYDWLFHLFR